MSIHTVRFSTPLADGHLNTDDYNTAQTLATDDKIVLVTNDAIMTKEAIFLVSVCDNGHAQEEYEKHKIGHRRVDKQGEVSYKRVPTNALMSAIQMGIANAVGSLASVPVRDILITDFYMVETVAFPSNGSQLTPAHSFGDFRFQTFAPIAFRYFRELFNIETADFLHSICFEPLQELSNPGASGSIFYVTFDERFIIKTVQHNEADFLQSLLPSYFMNLKQNALTLLPKFFGFFCYQRLGKNIRLIVMNNLLPQSVMMHEKYDLKGSTYKRYASKLERLKTFPTLKDLDFIKKHPEGFYLEKDKYETVMKTLERDCLVLQSCKIMDYSLLVGVHRLEPCDGFRSDDCHNEDDIDKTADSGGYAASLTDKVRNRFVSNFADHRGVFPARNYKGQDIILFLGVIDILQKYRFFKKFEHTWKSLVYKADSVSVHNPSFYASRFLRFMKGSVFHSCMPFLIFSNLNILIKDWLRMIYRAIRFCKDRRKTKKRKIERLFAPESSSLLDQESNDDGALADFLMRDVSREAVSLISCEAEVDRQEAVGHEKKSSRAKSASEPEIVHVDCFSKKVSEHTVMGNFITRIYIAPSS
uniref:PIPK domain-containing protein n=1 Tax=Syphacia muris TaxID=451379 RepID=A0A0N5AGN9_9BILA